MEQSEVELNEKLARQLSERNDKDALKQKVALWAGFTPGIVIDKRKGLHFEGNAKVPDWKQPDGQTSWCGSSKGWLPDFPHDLNACFKWLVPKLVQVQLVVTPGLRNAASVYVDPHANNQSMFEAEAAHLALALCRAIEQMIDAEHPA